MADFRNSMDFMKNLRSSNTPNKSNKNSISKKQSGSFLKAHSNQRQTAYFGKKSSLGRNQLDEFETFQGNGSNAKNLQQNSQLSSRVNSAISGRKSQMGRGAVNLN
ncbi:hypothetical protein PPERSA_05260 [Pseudocohnilembus persalinus]|uniref:Uncharacterized protein n=1 Tax=Pseudocohnilembus persalinus TaxID=266149 RepID=A0A0V0QYX5_PSEPJ|nr:hypothetical protein PPERSA_05260 [Pseudocohnilembus persalinus]|eukprot:KRX07096.1 hypothetical protein PPERSA_05260 [Pseudocohnilembus persalinus]